MKATIALLIITVTLCIGCQKETVDSQLTIAEGEQVKLANGLVVKIHRTLNYLCPDSKEIVCITGGAAVVDLSVGSQRDTLCIGPDCRRDWRNKPDTKAFISGNKATTVKLLSITPGVLDIQTSKRAVLQVN